MGIFTFSYFHIHHIFLARALGFEPRSKVLETSILPLNYARKKAKSYLALGQTAFSDIAKI